MIPLSSWYYAISAQSLIERAADPEDAFEERLREMACPVLMIWGNDESRHGLWTAIADRIARPDVHALVLPDCEHHFIGHEDEVAEAVVRFVTG